MKMYLSVFLPIFFSTVFLMATSFLATAASAQMKEDYSIQAEELPSERAYESNLKNIFKKYSQSHLSSKKMREMLESLGDEAYTIKKGDTLWEISETLFGDGFYWPKIWSFNPSISNPHQIEMGDLIRFDYGGYGKPPSVELIRQDDIEIPPSEIRSTPLLTKIPSSLSEDPLELRAKTYGQVGFFASMKLKKTLNPIVKLSSFYADAYPQELGEVTELLPGRIRASYLDSIYVEMKRGQIGQVYTVIGKEPESIESYDPTRDRSVEGVVIKVLGEIRLLELVNSEDRLFRAQVIMSLDLLEKGSVVIKGRVRGVRISRDGRAVKVRAKVVGGGVERDRKVLGLGSIIFLNVGGGDGVAVGDVVSIIANEKERKESTEIQVGHRILSRATVVSVDRSVSTAIIVESNAEVAAGDIVL